MFFVHIPCLSRFFGVLVLAACRQPGQPEAEAVAALHAKLRPCVRHVPGPVLCPLIRTVLPRRLLSRQVRCPLWTLCLSSQCRSVALPRSVTSCRTLTLRRAFGLLWLTRPWPAARGNAIWNDEWSPPSACWGRSTTWSWTCARTPLLLLPRPPWAVLCSLFLWICHLGKGAMLFLLSQHLLAMHCRHSLMPRGPRWTPSSQVPPPPHCPRTRKLSFPPALLLPFPWTPKFLMFSAPRSWLVITSTSPSFLSPPSSNPKNSLFPSTEAPVNPPSACPRPGPRMRSCLLINVGGPFNCTCPSTCCSRPTSHVL